MDQDNRSIAMVRRRLLIDIVTAMSPVEQHKIVVAAQAFMHDEKAPTVVTIDIRPYEHQEYPKTLYKGDNTITVAGDEEEDTVRNAGYGDHGTPDDEPEPEPEPANVQEIRPAGSAGAVESRPNGPTATQPSGSTENQPSDPREAKYASQPVPSNINPETGATGSPVSEPAANNAQPQADQIGE